MNTSNILKTIYLDLINSDISENPFKATRKLIDAENAIYELAINPLISEDQERGFRLEEAFCTAVNETKEEAFCVGFNTAISLIFNR